MTAGSGGTCTACGCPTEKWLAPKEVAATLRVTPKTIITLAAANELVGRQVGRHWRITHDSVHAYLGIAEQPARCA